MRSFRVSCTLRAPPAEVWARAATIEGVNADLALEAVEPGRGFSERSRLGSCSAWRHDRTLHPLAGGGTRVVDEVAFRWRHRRLRRIWGAA